LGKIFTDSDAAKPTRRTDNSWDQRKMDRLMGKDYMEEHKYRGQLIRVLATKTPGTGYWTARADIRYQDRKGLRFFPLRRPRSRFKSKESAEQNMIKEAKKHIDRLIQA
jgi:hypothetical protein